MKISLGLVNVDGYEHLGLRKNIDDCVEAASCNDIYAPDVLDYIHNEELVPYITHIVSKLRHGGKIVFGGTDLFELMKFGFRTEYSLSEINKKLFGELGNKEKSGCHNLAAITVLLQNLGLKIMKKRLEKDRFVIEAVRP